MKRNILLNPGPVTTTESVKKAMCVPDICHRETDFTTIVNSIRRDLLKIVHAQKDFTTVLFASSGTGAVEACINSVIAPQQKIMIINNGAYGQRIIEIARRYQIDVIEIKSDFRQAINLVKIAEQCEKDPAIQFIAVVHHETSSGRLNPIREIGTICRKYQRRMIVDAMSSYAGCEIDVDLDHIDYLIASANKCLQGAAGVSFVICRHSELKNPTHCPRSYYFDLYQQYRSLETTGEMPFTPPVQVIYGLRQAIDEYFAETGEKRFARYRRLYARLSQGMKKLGFQCLTPPQYHSQLLMIVSFPNDGIDYQFNDLHDYLYARGYTIYPQKIAIPRSFRLSCIGDLNENDIDRFLQEVKFYLSFIHQRQRVAITEE